MIARITNSILILTLLMPFTAGAVSDTFTISQSIITTDNDAPSIPANLSATAVATTQIDLSWDASTDNIAVAGYQVFRDNVQVATSTGTSYSDTGLTPNTLYTYYVTAFDDADNISASSTSASATTLSEVAPEEEDEDTSANGRSGDSILPELVSLSIVPTENAAVITWETNIYTRGVVQWGETASYELGSTVAETFAKKHSTVVTDLSPGTFYELSIGAITTYGKTFSLVKTRFKTFALPDTSPPPNVWNFHARRDGDDVQLTWDNPHDTDFDHVRIMRSGTFFPSDPYDGFLIYEDTGESYRDKDAAVDGGTVFYTAFVYDTNGRISSGAVAYVVIDGEDVFKAEPVPGEAPIDFGILHFFQDGKELPKQADGRVIIDASRQLTAVIAYDALPERLKTAVVTLADPNDPNRIFSFLLRINEAKDAYLATIAPLSRAGFYPLSFSMFDYEQQKLSTVHGAIEAKLPDTASRERSLPAIIAGINPYLFWLILLILLIVAHQLMKDRNRKQRLTLDDPAPGAT